MKEMDKLVAQKSDDDIGYATEWVHVGLFPSFNLTRLV